MVNKKEQTKFEKLKASNIDEAVDQLKKLATEKKRNFKESVDISVKLGIDAKQSDQMVKGSILLPNGSGKKVKVVVITASEDNKKAALDSGAEIAGFEDVIAKIDGGFVNFDTCIATPDVMPKIAKVARKLGPRGLMPSPKNGTVTNDVTKAVSDAIKGKVDFRNDKAGIVHCLIGKVDFEKNHLIENVRSVLKSIKDLKPESAKGKYIKSLHFSTTMGPSVEVAVDSL